MSVEGVVIDFFYRYFWELMFMRSGYNVVNIFVYVFFFGLGVIYIYKWIIKLLKIFVDERFFWVVILMVVFGVIVRVFVDGGVLF